MKKLSDKQKKIVTRVESSILTAATTLAYMAPTLAAYADPTTTAGQKNLINSVLGVIGTILIIPAVGVLIFGIYSYAMAHGEGDGPATGKATKQIFAGIMMGVVAGLLKVAGNENSTIGTMINKMF